MYKLISNTFDFKTNSITKLSYDNVLKKTASTESTLMQDYIKNTLKKEEGKTKFHALFLGAGEYYGCNRNGDYFKEADLKRTYKTFEKFGHVFKNHVNKDPNESFGTIEYVIYNDKMHRVEGIISLDNDKNKDVLDDYDAGKSIPVSMGAKLKFDICSICGNEAKNLDKYCTHLKNEMCDIYPDGRMVYAINPDPVFFDISVVWRPADPTAYFFSKIAGERTKKKNLSVFWGEYYQDVFNKRFEKIGMNTENIEKKALIQKLSELEKHIEGVIVDKLTDDDLENEDALLKDVSVPLMKRVASTTDLPELLLEKLKKFPLETVLKKCTGSKILLKLKEFLSLLDQEDSFQEVQKVLPSSFTRLLEAFGNEGSKEEFDLDFGEEADDETSILSIKDLLKGFCNHRMLDDSFFTRGGRNISLRSNPPVKIRLIIGPDSMGISKSKNFSKVIIKSSKEQLVFTKLANIYNLYKLSFCKKVKNKSAIMYAVLDNYIKQ